MKKSNNTSGILVLVILLTTIVICGYEFGITGVTNKPGSIPGCSCHSTNPSLNVKVNIIGPDTLIINQEAVYSVTISGGPLLAAGTDIASSSGTLIPQTGSGLQSQNGELTHHSPKSPVGGIVTFQFKYKAPAANGAVILYANGNSVNLDLNPTGDEWNFAPNKNITIMNPLAGINDPVNLPSFILEQNYPNPFNPSTVIRYAIPFESNVIISFYNSLGKGVREVNEGIRNPGIYELNFNSSGLASGVYFYSIKVASLDGKNNFSAVKKMILAK